MLITEVPTYCKIIFDAAININTNASFFQDIKCLPLLYLK